MGCYLTNSSLRIIFLLLDPSKKTSHGQVSSSSLFRKPEIEHLFINFGLKKGLVPPCRTQFSLSFLRNDVIPVFNQNHQNTFFSLTKNCLGVFCTKNTLKWGKLKLEICSSGNWFKMTYVSCVQDQFTHVISNGCSLSTSQLSKLSSQAAQ